MDKERNKRLHKLMNLCWHEFKYGTDCDFCGEDFNYEFCKEPWTMMNNGNPDYTQWETTESCLSI
jgi:hypothetical protein